MYTALVFIALLVIPKEAPTYAGWPAALITSRMYEWYPILVGTAFVELLILRKIGNTDWKGALKAAFASNAISALAGIIFLPLAGIVWKYSLNRTVEVFGVYGNYSMASWIGNVIYMAILLGAIKSLMISLAIDKKLSLSFVMGWMLVNLLPLLVTIATFNIVPPDPSQL